MWMKKSKRTMMIVLMMAAMFSAVGCSSESAQQPVEQEKQVVDEEVATSPEAIEMKKAFELDKQPVIGNRDAKVQIVEFGDYKCFYCKVWTEEMLPKLEEDYLKTGKAAFYYLNMPFLAPDSMTAALAGEYMYTQGEEQFWRFHHLLNEKQGKKNEPWANEKALHKLVVEHFPEVDDKAFLEALKQQTNMAEVQLDEKIANEARVMGTPTIIVNGKMVEGETYEELKEAIDVALAEN